MLVTALYWSLVALGSLLMLTIGFDLPVGDHDPVPEQTLAGVMPRTAYLVIVAVLAFLLASTTAALGAAARLVGGAAAERRATRLGEPLAAQSGLIVAGGLAALVLLLLSLSAGLLAFVGYLPLALVITPFHEGMREGFLAAVTPSVLSQLVLVVGALLWGAAVRRYVRVRPIALPAWAHPDAAARWGRVAVAVAVIPPLVYAGTRFVWLIYPLGFDRAAWEAERAAGALLPGVWLGAFALVGAVLTLGLAQRWGEVFPRWVPGLASRRVPVALAVVPAGFVSAIVVPAGISMIRQVITDAAGFDFAADWAAFGPTFLWPLWGVALGAATLGYALRRRREQPAEAPPSTSRS